MFKAIHRWLIYLGLLVEKASETDAINEALVERGIRDSKAKADKSHYANGQLKASSIMLKHQVRQQEQERDQLKLMLDAAVAQNDEANGAEYAERLADKEADLATNTEQLKTLDEQYKVNTQIIAESLRQMQKFEREFQATKARVAVSRNLQNLAGLMKSSISELQGMVGGEMSEAMNRMKQAAASGEGQMQATLDLAKEMGSNIRVQQDARKARGKALFEQYKQKHSVGVQSSETQTQAEAESNTPAREKITVNA
jgi:hypothetical protein